MKKILKKKNKKAWLKIVEAFLSILIVLGAVLVIVSKQETRLLDKIAKTGEEGIYEKQKEVLDAVSRNETLRGIIVSKNLGSKSYAFESYKTWHPLNDFIYLILPSSWNFATNICKAAEGVCPNPVSSDLMLGKEIYVEEKIITSTLETYSPKRVKLFIWFGDPEGYVPKPEDIPVVDGDECEINEDCSTQYDDKPFCNDQGMCEEFPCDNTDDCIIQFGNEYTCDGEKCIKN